MKITQILGINISPEMELIIKCSKTLIDNEQALVIQSLVKQDLDWQYIIKTACYHGLIPLLYNNIQAIAKYLIPETEFKELYNIFYKNTQHNLMLAGELVNIIRFLEKDGIVAVPYKGPFLAHLLYKNIALRQFCDLDIIVQKSDVLKVKNILIARGYRPKIALTVAEEIAYLQSKSEHTYDFIDDIKGILIEIHWRITPKYKSPIEPKHFWKNLELFGFAGTKIHNLPLEDWLLILCVHGSRHRWEKLSWFADIAQLIQTQPNLNWQKVIKQASEFDCKRMLFLGLFFAHKVIGVSLPEAVLKAIKADREVSNLAKEICQEIFSQETNSGKIMSNTVYHMRVREQLSNKVLYFESFLRWLIKPIKQS